ncbi:MAG: ThiF family adenylyltransferase, partial [Phycisphaerae bacterium]
MNEHDLSNRYTRQKDIVPADRLADLTVVTVIGVGAIGRQVTLQLAAIGVPRLQLVDFDRVEVENLAPQGFLESDMEQLKVQATANLARQINHDLDIREVLERFRRSMDVGDAIFNCVDSIETRRHIWQAVRDRVRFYVDCRMSAEVARILVAADAASREH